jgi:hypothetical protein
MNKISNSLGVIAMFTDFDSLKLESESRRLDRQIDKLMAVSSKLNDILEKVPYSEKYTIDLLNEEYWENSRKLKVLFSVQKNIDNIIELGENDH